MSIYFKKSTIIKDSSGFSYSFYLSNEGSIDYKSFNLDNQLISTNNLINGGVLEFSTCIDKSDSIHLIALNQFGELRYFTFIDNTWNSDVINQLDLRSNNYKYLNLVVFDESIGYICSYSNLVNSVVWTIEYTSIKPTIEKKCIETIYAGENFSPYSFDIDKFNNIHLLYRAIENRTSQIYYINFSPFLNVYQRPPVKVSSNKTNNFHPYIFIDSSHQINIMWTKKTHCDSSLEIMVMRDVDSQFKTLNITKSKSKTNYPIMLEENNILKALYYSNDSLGMISSDNFGLSWSREEIIPRAYEQIYLARYSSNYLDNKNISNMRHSYSFINNDISWPFSNTSKANNDDLEESLLEDLLENQVIDLNSNLAVDSINTDYVDKTLTKIESFISKNLIAIDNSLCCDNNCFDAIKKVEVKLMEHKSKNNDLLELINSIDNYYKLNSLTIEKLENDLNNLKANLENKNNSFFKSLFSKFK